MRVAHLIIAHQKPVQVRRLIHRIIHKDADIYLHIDKKADYKSFIRELDGCPIKVIDRRLDCNWGGYSIINAILASCAEILDGNKSYQFINLLSGQDYPLVTADSFLSFLRRHPGYSFIPYDMGDDQWKEAAKQRYERYHFTDYRFPGRYVVENLMNKLFPKRVFPADIRFYGSTNACWWTFDAGHMAFILKRIAGDASLRRFFSFTWGADEFLFPSLLMASIHKDRVINNNFRYIDWSEGQARPKILVTADFELLIQSKMLFARKFDMDVDSRIMEMIDEYLDTEK